MYNYYECIIIFTFAAFYGMKYVRPYFSTVSLWSERKNSETFRKSQVTNHDLHNSR